MTRRMILIPWEEYCKLKKSTKLIGKGPSLKEAEISKDLTEDERISKQPAEEVADYSTRRITATGLHEPPGLPTKGWLTWT